MTVVDELRRRAQAERQITQLPAEEWPEQVWRAYHVGRRTAFTEAAALVEEPEPGARREDSTHEQHHHV